MAEEGAPAAEGEKPAAAPGADSGSTGYDYRKVHSYPLIKVNSFCIVENAHWVHSLST